MKNRHNPDVLNCLANLSSDEVFTTPDLANQLLNNLPKEIFEDESVTFLDPCLKSGIFLREIVKRLDKGLAFKILDKETRINHILSNHRRMSYYFPSQNPKTKFKKTPFNF